MSVFDIYTSRIPAETVRSSHAGPAQASERRELQRAPASFHPALAFLASYGVPPNVLIQASVLAAAQGIRPEQALLGHGLMSADDYYKTLARHLGLAYAGEEIRFGSLASFPHSITAGVAPLASVPDGPAWLIAPEGRRLDELLTLHRRGGLPRGRFAIISPDGLSRSVLAEHGPAAAEMAASGLIQLHGAAFSALRARGPKITAGLMIAALALLSAWTAGGMIWFALSMAFSLFICAAVSLRLFAAAASCDMPAVTKTPRLRDDELPVYTVVVALYREANIVTDLTAALDAIDYPQGRLDIKLVVEAEDHETRAALTALGLPARYQVITAPDGLPRTKPRALNVALPLARGSLVCVFDAEDVPEAGQLREAAESFAILPHHVACLQGRLAIDNHGDSWLARCFAIEYAALFEVINPGLSALRLPVPLGGTSNHFRRDVLQDIGGWDAWNVTEDIDLGLRLARFGYETGTLEAATFEEAPAALGPWMRQRRRWFKGWIQTFLVHLGRPRAAVAGMGLFRALAALLHVGGTLAGAMLGPFFAAFAVHDAIFGNLLSPATWLEVAASTFWCFAGLAGMFAAFWPAILGMKRRKILKLAPAVPLLIVYWVLTTIAAWWALADFLRNPFNWLKTDHGKALVREHGAGGRVTAT